MSHSRPNVHPRPLIPALSSKLAILGLILLGGSLAAAEADYESRVTRLGDRAALVPIGSFGVAAGRLQSESAARALEALIAARGPEAAAAEFRKTIAGSPRYGMSEREMVTLGYRYLREGRPAEALAVFTLNSEAFPKSWNAWDSLAEASFAGGNLEAAERFYARSVEINPGNENGKLQLSRLRGYKHDTEGETREARRFEPGSATGLEGPCLGQKPPGLKAEPFAPGIVSTAGAMEFSVAFSPDGREMYFCRRTDGGRNSILFSRLEESGWTAPREAPFSVGFPSTEPFITPDGKSLYFGTTRPKKPGEKAAYAIWVADRSAGGGFGEPRLHGPGMFVSATAGGDLYMTDVTGLVSPDRPVVVYPKTRDGWEAPRRVGGGVNAPAVADHAFIAPDGSYILFDSTRPGGQGGEGDLYVCFKKRDGSWSGAYNLGDAVNTAGTDFCPSVTPDGKFIFFSTRRDVYWVSAEILAPLRAKALSE